jgi:hypothetical protein
VATGSAPISGGDIGQARELAMRRAMSRAAQSHGTLINSETIVRPGVVLESSQMRTTACTGDSTVIDERMSNGELSVTMKVTVKNDGECPQLCARSYINKLIITDFSFEFPEQILPLEKSIFKYKTAGEIARAVRRHHRSQVGFDDMAIPYVSPSEAPEPFTLKTDTESPFVRLARSHRGQYVLSGVYRDFEIGRNRSNILTRRIEIEAFIHDGANGSLLSRQTFMGTATGAVEITDTPVIGSTGFYETDFGSVWGLMLEDIAGWAEEKTACYPFIARVIKNSSEGIVIDAGAESGLSAGDTLNLHGWRDQDVRSITDLHLGTEKELRGTASLKTVYPRFSIVQVIGKSNILDKIRVGDLLYSQ